ncbi:MAG: hypothetical protein H0U44_08320 [Flavisolibacter sp.]|nr:hypothetical protein [Flavisolibacter sp.]
MKRHLTTVEEIKQAQLLFKKGMLVAERKEGFFKIQLFQLENSYMEVYKHAHFNVTIKATCFNELSFLDPYLEQISLKGILPGY